VTHVAHWLAEPLAHLPARRPGSIRRTSHLDVAGLDDGGLALTGSAHDDAHDVSCRVVLAADRSVTALDVVPDDPDLRPLLGRVVGRGFRALVDEVCESGTLLSGLLTELPVVSLLSGYGTLYSGQLSTPLTDRFIEGMPVDVCAGWAGTGFMMGHIRDQREIPTPDGPPVPADHAGWHPMPALEVGVLRRQRLIERAGDEVWAMFRDTYSRPDGVTSVLHEYTVTATISDATSDDPGDDRVAERVAACVATPRVLPWGECPQAAASAERLVGRRVDDLRAMVRDDLVGTTTCTHLNDLLASLSQAGRLV
jgi:Protein of unknown function (DUF2889)